MKLLNLVICKMHSSLPSHQLLLFCAIVDRPRRLTSRVQRIHVSLRSSVLLTLNRSHHPPRVLHRPKLQIPNPLPRPCVQPSIRNRNRHTGANKRRLDMSLHMHPLALSIPSKTPPPNSPAYHRSPQHHAYTGPSPSCPRAQCGPAHRSCLRAHRRRSSRSATARTTCAG
jgi:hypothetical protein